MLILQVPQVCGVLDKSETQTVFMTSNFKAPRGIFSQKDSQKVLGGIKVSMSNIQFKYITCSMFKKKPLYFRFLRATLSTYLRMTKPTCILRAHTATRSWLILQQTGACVCTFI